MTGQDMSPDFVLMRLVSAAEYDQLEPEDEGVDSELAEGLDSTPAKEVKNETYCHETLPVQKCQWVPVLRLTKVEVDGDDARHENVNVDWANTLTSTSSNPGLIQESALKDPVLSSAKQLGETLNPEVLAKGNKQVCAPGEEPSDALLVLRGLNAEQVASSDPEDSSLSQAVNSSSVLSSPLSGLMRQVHCLIPDDPEPELMAPVLKSMPRSRPPTPKRVGSPLVLSACSSNNSINEATKEREQERASRRKCRKGSLKVCLSKLFRSKSGTSGAVDGHPGNKMSNKRPSFASSTSSGEGLVDVYESSEPDTPRSQKVRPHSSYSAVPFTGETVSLVDVDISQRSVNSIHSPTPPPPPRRSLSLLDDLGAPQPGHLPSSMQSLQVSHPPIQLSLSLNDTMLDSGLPAPRILQPDSQSGASVQRRSLLCPLPSSFATSLRELEKCGWYWGPMNWEDAEMKLKGKPDGSFLVRDSSDPRYILSLSFRSQGITHHTRMEHYRGTFSLWCHPKFEDRCHSVVEFIERAIMHSKNGRFLYFLRSRVPGLPPTPVQLLYPVSRFCNVKSLQHLCRFCVRQLVRIDHVQELPLPKPLIVYLRKFYFYDQDEEHDLSVTDSGRDTGAQEAASQT